MDDTERLRDLTKTQLILDKTRDDISVEADEFAENHWRLISDWCGCSQNEAEQLAIKLQLYLKGDLTLPD